MAKRSHDDMRDSMTSEADAAKQQMEVVTQEHNTRKQKRQNAIGGVVKDIPKYHNNIQQASAVLSTLRRKIKVSRNRFERHNQKLIPIVEALAIAGNVKEPES